LKGAGRTPYSRTPTAARCCAPRCASSCAARRCTTSACRPRARSVSGRHRRAGHARHVLRRQSGSPNRARSCAASPRAFVRFGNFEILAARRARAARRLADYVMQRALSRAGAVAATYAAGSRGLPPHRRLDGAHWMRVGFVHGVMNTDNMSILGLTIDYGPYGWLEGYDPQLDAQHHRCAGPALPLRQPAADRAVEPGAARQRAR
jgi:serine/tyrosine/threonine adenylyltransferase